MIAMHCIRVGLPDGLYQQVRDAADRSDQPVETVLVGSLTLLFGDSPGGWDQFAGSLESLPLRAALGARLSPGSLAGGRAPRELTARGKQAVPTLSCASDTGTLADEWRNPRWLP